MAAAVLAELAAIFLVGWAKPAASDGALSPENVEQIGRALYTDYLIPFELASFLLLVAMIGAIILAKREL
jgi:NADH:ubiquinone oxidoreductase subunit 6 (subunit J)